MTNVLKVLLHKNEESLACLLTGFYEGALEEDMMLSAIEKN